MKVTRRSFIGTAAATLAGSTVLLRLAKPERLGFVLYDETGRRIANEEYQLDENDPHEGDLFTAQFGPDDIDFGPTGVAILAAIEFHSLSTGECLVRREIGPVYMDRDFRMVVNWRIKYENG